MVHFLKFYFQKTGAKVVLCLLMAHKTRFQNLISKNIYVRKFDAIQYFLMKQIAYSVYAQVSSLKAILAPTSSVPSNNDQQDQSFETKQPPMKKG